MIPFGVMPSKQAGTGTKTRHKIVSVSLMVAVSQGSKHGWEYDQQTSALGAHVASIGSQGTRVYPPCPPSLGRDAEFHCTGIKVCQCIGRYVRTIDVPVKVIVNHFGCTRVGALTSEHNNILCPWRVRSV